MEVFQIRYKILIAFIILISLSLSCAYANDSNGTELELELNDDASQELNLEVPNDSDDILESSSEEEILSEDSGDILESTSDGEILSKSSNDNTDSSANLILDNDANIENIYIGDLVVWIVSVINKGPDTAKNVKVFDQLPEGLKYVKHTTSKGTFNPKTGIWNIGNLSVEDGEVFLNITTKAISTGEKINKANLTTDSINLNNESYEEEEIDVFEHSEEDSSSKTVHAATIYATGNPLALALISLLMIFATSIKSKE